MVPRLSTSLLMLRDTPGNWTLIARSRPSWSTARCTWPIDAAAIGLMSNSRKRDSQSRPQARPRTRRNCVSGIPVPSACRTAIAAANCGGSKSSPSMERSCPSFIAAPRIADSCLARRSALAAVRRALVGLETPVASRRADSAMPPIATSPASQPNRARRSSLPAGTRACFRAVAAVISVTRPSCCRCSDDGLLFGSAHGAIATAPARRYSPRGRRPLCRRWSRRRRRGSGRTAPGP
jgi:hypothetical protein